MVARPLQNERLNRFTLNTKSLPSLPSLYLELEKELRSPLATARRVDRIISKDMAMTAKILQLANSAYYGVSREVSTVERAVILLGLDLVKNLVLVVHVFSQFNLAKMKVLPVAGLWRHSMACSGIARKLAIAENAPRDRVDQATTAGFLHDIGKLILANTQPEQYQLMALKARGVPLYLAEEDRFGFNHAELGGYFLRLWGLPSPIIQAVAYHHHPHQAPEKVFSPLTAVHVANCLEREKSEGPPTLGRSEIDEDYLARLSLGGQVEKWQQLSHQLAGSRT
ncbi:MAG: HDOD domain-containing protein [Acidobacteriota bacterium]